MAGAVEKNYAEALLSLTLEENENNLKAVLFELETINNLFAENPDFIKLMNTPTISIDEKLDIISKAFGGKTTPHVFSFLCLLARKGRYGYFSKIYSQFLLLYNEHFNIAEITVISTMPITKEQKVQISEKMSKVTGKTISIKEKIDASLIGGIVIDYGNTRFDGSVRSRLDALKAEIGNIIA